MADEKNADLFDPRGLQGDGKCEMVIFANGNKVIQRFDRPMLFIAYDLQNVGPVVNRLIGAIREAGGQPVIEMPRRQISREKREALVTRATHVFRSMTEKRQSPKDVARHVVDSILSAID